MKCLDKRVLIGLGVVGIGVFVAWPGAALTVAPFLVAAVCPLSMLITMRRGQDGHSCGRATNASEGSKFVREAQLTELRAEVDRLKARRGHQPVSPTNVE